MDVGGGGVGIIVKGGVGRRVLESSWDWSMLGLDRRGIGKVFRKKKGYRKLFILFDVEDVRRGVWGN